MANKIRSIIKKNWHMITADPHLKDIASNGPLITFRRSKTIKDHVVRSRLTAPRKNWLKKLVPQGNHKCGNCNHCRNLVEGKMLKIGGIEHTVKQFISCRSTYVVYCIFCPCHRFYIGQTIRPMFTRFREHKNSVKKGNGAPRLIEHVRKSHGGNPNALSFVGLETIQVPTNGGDRHRTLLRREAWWILKTQALGPLGMNDKNDMGVFL